MPSRYIVLWKEVFGRGMHVAQLQRQSRQQLRNNSSYVQPREVQSQDRDNTVVDIQA